MRVLFYLGQPAWSGCARATLALAAGAARRGRDVLVACCGGSRLEALARERGLDTVALDGSHGAVGGAFDVRRVVRERAIDVAVVATERDHLVVASAMRAARRGSVLRRVPPFEAVEVRRVGRLALGLARSGLLFSTDRELKNARVTGWALRPAAAPLGIDAASYDGVAPAARDSLGAPASCRLIACAYDATARHRVSAVFRTVALLAARHGDIHVAVVGPGSADDELRLHAAALGVMPVVSFLGDRPDDREVLRAADAAWVVCAADAGAYACLDAMALRLPVIADRGPLTEQYVADGISGVLLATTDPSHMASSVAAFLTVPERRAAMGQAGRGRVQRDFTEAGMIDGLEAALDQAATGPRPRGTPAAR